MRVEIYSDGSCDDNQNGGYGVLIKIIDGINLTEEIELLDGKANTTSTQMELLGAISAIEYLKRNFSEKFERIDLFADYKKIEDNMNGNRDVTKEDFNTSADRDLWMKLHNLTHNENAFFHWVKGHNGDPDNIRADKLAREGRIKFLFAQKSKVFVYYCNVTTYTNKNSAEGASKSLFNVMLKSEEKNEEDTLMKKVISFDENKVKDFIELHTLRESLSYAIKNTKDIENKKVILFCNQPTIIKTIINIKKNKVKKEELRYQELWNPIIKMLENYDINIYKCGQSKLNFFNMSVEQHSENQLKVRNFKAAV